MGEEERLEFLYLLAERAALLGLGQAGVSISSSICNLVKDADNEMLHKAEDLATRHAASVPDAYLQGIIDALPQRIAAHPEDVSLVSQFATLGPRLLSRSPSTALAFVQAARAGDAQHVDDAITSWLRSIKDADARARLRIALLPYLSAREIALVRELIAGVAEPELPSLCNAIEQGPAANDVDVSRTCAQAFCEIAPEWVASSSNRPAFETYFAAFLRGFAVPLNEETLDELLVSVHGRRKAALLLTFVARIERRGPSWLQRKLAQDLHFWSAIADVGTDGFASEELDRLCARTPRACIARIPSAPSRLQFASSSVQDYAIQQMVLDWLDGLSDQASFHGWLGTLWVSSRLQRNADNVLIPVTRRYQWDADSWERVWQLIALLPFGQRFSIKAADILDHLIRTRPRTSPGDVSQHWIRFFDVFTSDPVTQLELYTRSLQFALDHADLPIPAVAARSFFPVHDAAMKQKAVKSWTLFGLVQWDKGLELRRLLVNAFHAGNWSPRWFVIAAHEPWLLRKLCKRMMRQWQGEEFLQKAFLDLREHADEAPDLLACLADILRTPDYQEEWD